MGSKLLEHGKKGRSLAQKMTGKGVFEHVPQTDTRWENESAGIYVIFSSYPHGRGGIQRLVEGRSQACVLWGIRVGEKREVGVQAGGTQLEEVRK